MLEFFKQKRPHYTILNIKKLRILMLDLTFKEHIPDLRNTKIIELKNYLKQMGHLITFIATTNGYSNL